MLQNQFDLKLILEHLRSKKVFQRGEVIYPSQKRTPFTNLNQLETIFLELKWNDAEIAKVWLYGTGWYMK